MGSFDGGNHLPSLIRHEGGYAHLSVCAQLNIQKLYMKTYHQWYGPYTQLYIDNLKLYEDFVPLTKQLSVWLETKSTLHRADIL